MRHPQVRGTVLRQNETGSASHEVFRIIPGQTGLSACAAAAAAFESTVTIVAVVTVASVAAAAVAVHKQKDEGDDDQPYDRIVKNITETAHLIYLSFLVGKPDLLIVFRALPLFSTII